MRSILGIALALTLSACGSGSGGGTGTLDLDIGDTPVDGATHVMITVTGVELQQGGTGTTDMDGMSMMDGMGMSMSGTSAQEFDFAHPKTIDLLHEQGGATAALLSGINVPTGQYSGIRLKLDPSKSSITLADGSVHDLPLTVLNGASLQANDLFQVQESGASHLTIDFDLRQSVVQAGGAYQLQPRLRLIDDSQSGTIMGSAANTLSIGGSPISDPACKPAVYIYTGLGVQPVDIDNGASVQPAATAALSLNDRTGTYDYKAAFLPPHTYTMALVCAGLDDPNKVDSLVFTTPLKADIAARRTVVVDFR